ncbi:Metal-dependent hydrolase, endonuclease/exonuclease/phosphatase family [Halorubrum aquaticum]|uniref:Metal-dependent hydrolase, endonuclease/exonuclease/phosphatase family n=1 Tax=Halorubrum aquaticum TaxID=387340 RepID=A0A1I3CRW3_9EURY|nr:endonuclease/exonuclease/phosphatase family protein [Halorubrum aquaticum]SFH77284.1 Metal-dependent hydrolase, endonuclease/exonuclease/phosphatase family [Halorubrum aquaticum]
MSRIRVLSYNVRYDNRHDGHDAWHARRDGVASVVRFHRPDVVAFQEPLPGQRADLRERLPEYDLLGRGRKRDDDGEGCPIGVRTDRWRVVENGTFWLSETPTEPSTDWDAAHPRIATWVRIRPRERVDGPTAPADSSLLVVNTHFDHVSARARRESARLLRERIPELAAASGAGRSGDPVDDSAGDSIDGAERVPRVLVGDFNCTPGSDPHRILTGKRPEAADGPDGGANGDPDDGEIGATVGGSTVDTENALRDAAATADVRHGPRTSLTDFSRLIDGRRIDHVLVSPDVDAEAFATLADRDDRGRYPSDHLPVFARLRL